MQADGLGRLAVMARIAALLCLGMWQAGGDTHPSGELVSIRNGLVSCLPGCPDMLSISVCRKASGGEGGIGCSGKGRQGKGTCAQLEGARPGLTAKARTSTTQSRRLPCPLVRSEPHLPPAYLAERSFFCREMGSSEGLTVASFNSLPL